MGTKLIELFSWFIELLSWFILLLWSIILSVFKAPDKSQDKSEDKSKAEDESKENNLQLGPLEIDLLKFWKVQQAKERAEAAQNRVGTGDRPDNKFARYRDGVKDFLSQREEMRLQEEKRLLIENAQEEEKRLQMAQLENRERMEGIIKAAQQKRAKEAAAAAARLAPQKLAQEKFADALKQHGQPVDGWIRAPER